MYRDPEKTDAFVSGLTDGYQRRIDYLRISVTDRCNLKCIYCMPDGGLACMRREEVLTTSEIVRFASIARRCGVRKVRITGGEPLVRRDILELVAALKRDAGIGELSLTTNGLLLESMADRLRAAGLDRVNVSLDTMDAERYARITRGGDLIRVWKGIDAAEDAGLTPIKLNMVPLRGVNEDEIRNFALLTLDRDYHVRFIEFMPTAGNGWSESVCVPGREVRDRVSALGMLAPLEFRGGGPSRNYKLNEGRGVIGFISPVTDHFCRSCNRLRLSADGRIRPCLFSGQSFDARSLLRRKASDGELMHLVEEAVNAKPSGHHIQNLGNRASSFVSLSQIGG